MATKTKSVYWISEPPTHCDLSGLPIGDTFVDGRLPDLGTSWGCFLPEKFADAGGRLGMGLGQRYVRQPAGQEDAGRWLKVEG